MARVLLLVGSLVFAVALAEGLLRLLWTNPYAGEEADRVVHLWLPHVHMDRVIDRSLIFPDSPEARLRTDHRGYTMPSFRHEDPDLTIAFLGGSTTANTVVSEDLRFHVVAADALERDGLRVNALNAARPAGTLHDSLNVLLNHLVFDAPDIVVLMHATNDVGILSRPAGYRARGPFAVSTASLGYWAAQLLSSHSHLGALARRARQRVVVAEPAAKMDAKNDPSRPKVPTEPFRARLLSFVRVCRSFGIEPVLMTQPLSSSRSALTPDWADLGNQDVFNAIIRQVGEQEGVLVVDLVTFLREEVPDWDAEGRLFWDGMHVTDEGSRVVGLEIARVLRPLALRLAAQKAVRE
jgi:lysophospholipase L1-like esterase